MSDDARALALAEKMLKTGARVFEDENGFYVQATEDQMSQIVALSRKDGAEVMREKAAKVADDAEDPDPAYRERGLRSPKVDVVADEIAAAIRRLEL